MFSSGESIEFLAKMTFLERDVHAMLENLDAVRKRMYEGIRVKALAAFPKLEKMRRV